VLAGVTNLSVEGGCDPDFVLANMFSDLCETQASPCLGFQELADDRGQFAVRGIMAGQDLFASSMWIFYSGKQEDAPTA
jgi:hypothetical protein